MTESRKIKAAHNKVAGRKPRTTSCRAEPPQTAAMPSPPAPRRQSKGTDARALQATSLNVLPAQTPAQTPLDALPELIALFRKAAYPQLLERAEPLMSSDLAQDATFWNVLAATYWRLKQVERAVEACEQSLRIRPNNAEICANLALALSDLDRQAEALASARAAIAADPAYAPGHNALGLALERSHQVAEAMAAYRDTIALDPKHAGARLNLGLLTLLHGDFESGLAGYEWRDRQDGAANGSFAAPRWTGAEDINGKVLFCHHDQGLGDTLMFIRYALLARELGAEVYVSVQNELFPLLRHFSPEITVLPSHRAPAHMDYFCPLPSMPFAFKTRPHTIPAPVPYTHSDPHRVFRWQRRLGDHGFKVGICWQGSTGTVDCGRSFPLALFGHLAKIAGVRLISLCRGEGELQLSHPSLGFDVEIPGPEFDPPGEEFLDTAAIARACDLVITSDTAVAHLAGSLGVTTWLLVKRYPDWRWQLEREDTPWYPTMRLFRQHRPDDWHDVFDRVASSLTAAVSSRTGLGTPVLPVAWGEIIDKLTILDLKAKHIADPTKLANVMLERSVLRRSCAPLSALDRGDLARLQSRLAEINASLWEVEDELRAAESRGDFGRTFIELARSVYRLNDERSRVKKSINQLTGSCLVEEKSYSYV